MKRLIVNTNSVHDTGGMYSHAVRAGDLVFVSGQVSRDIEGNLVGAGDIVAQVDQVFLNLENALIEAGSSLPEIVKMTTYLVGRETLLGFREVRDRVMGRPIPANTLLFVDGLAHEDYLVEIEAIAIASSSPIRST